MIFYIEDILIVITSFSHIDSTETSQYYNNKLIRRVIFLVNLNFANSRIYKFVKFENIYSAF